MGYLNDRYEKIVCINLKERKDKYEFMLAQFIKNDIQVEWFHPVIHNYANKIVKPLVDAKVAHFNVQYANEFNTMSSFYHVIKSALLDGAQSLFIIEDDFHMHKQFNELLPKYFDKLPADADIVMFYSYEHPLLPENIRVNSRWIKGYKSWSHLAIGMNRRYMEEYIKQLDAFPRIGDLVTYQAMENGFNAYVSYPVLGIPARRFSSDIRGNEKNYENPLIQNAFTFGLNYSNYE